MVTLRRLSQFIFDAAKLPTQIRILEDHVEEALRQLAAEKEDRFVVVGPVERQTQIGIGVMAIVANAAVPGIEIIIPVSSLQNVGARCAVVVMSGATPVVVRSLGGQSVHGSSYDTLTAIGSYVYRSTGSSWVRSA